MPGNSSSVIVDGLISDIADLVVGFNGNKSIYKAWANIEGSVAEVYFNPQTQPTIGNYLNVGDKVIDVNITYLGEPILWNVAGKNLPGMPLNSITLISEKIIDYLPYDAKESNNPISARAANGNPYFKVSNIKQWLESYSNNWYVPQHTYDTPPDFSHVDGREYINDTGFRFMFSNVMREKIMITSLTSIRPHLDGGGTEVYQSLVFLPSKSELGLGVENGINEGNMLPLFSVVNSSRVAYPTLIAAERGQISSLDTQPSSYCTRTSSYANDGLWSVSSTGSGNKVLNVSANQGIRPMINIQEDITIYGPIDGIYYVVSEINDPIRLRDRNSFDLSDVNSVPLYVKG